MLQIPIKGRLLESEGEEAQQGKIFPPAPANRFLGEHVCVGSSPCSVQPTEARKAAGRALLLEMLRTKRLAPGFAASIFGKLRFLGSELHGRCGLPALQPFERRQHEHTNAWNTALHSAAEWLLELLEAAGPREWPRRPTVPPALHIFGDASEPSAQASYCHRIGAVMVNAATGAAKFFEADVRASLLAVLPGDKHIYHLELLWPALAAFVWSQDLRSSYPVFYEDNRGAEFNLLKGFSSEFHSALLLALFWGASALQASRPWIARVASADNPADCLTKPGLDRSHLSHADREHESLEAFWNLVFACVRSKRFPPWSKFASNFQQTP